MTNLIRQLSPISTWQARIAAILIMETFQFELVITCIIGDNYVYRNTPIFFISNRPKIETVSCIVYFDTSTFELLDLQ